MAIIAIKRDRHGDKDFEGEEYLIDTDDWGVRKDGDLYCFGSPFSGVPLELAIAIRTDGSVALRSWTWSKNSNPYFHTHETPNTFTATDEQIDTVNGLLSGRIKFEGLKLSIGATIQDICPINREREEKLTGKRIYLNLRDRQEERDL